MPIKGFHAVFGPTVRIKAICLCFDNTGITDLIIIKKKYFRDFPGGPVVTTLPSNAGVADLIPGQGSKIPCASQPKNQNITQKQYCDKFNEDLKKNGPRQKKKSIFKERGISIFFYSCRKMLQNL